VLRTLAFTTWDNPPGNTGAAPGDDAKKCDSCSLVVVMFLRVEELIGFISKHPELSKCVQYA
jgi:hypothetical protein